MVEEKKARESRNVKVEHGDSFYSDNVAVMHTKDQVVLDFKQITPRLDQIGNSRQHTLVLKHNTVMMDPLRAKILLRLLTENIKIYENKFGEITLPKKKQEQKRKEDFSYIG